MIFAAVTRKNFEKQSKNRLFNTASKPYRVTHTVGKLQSAVQLPLPVLLRWLPVVHKFASVSTQFHLRAFSIPVTHLLSKVCPASLLFVLVHTVSCLAKENARISTKLTIPLRCCLGLYINSLYSALDHT